MTLHLRTARACLPAHGTRRGGAARDAARGVGRVRKVAVVYWGASAGGAIADCTVVTEPGRVGQGRGPVRVA